MRLTTKLLSAAIAALLLCLVAAGLGWRAETRRADSAETQVTLLTSQRDTANAIAQVRAEASKQALDVAIAAAKANHGEAVRLLNIPTPPPEERCKAASALVDEVIQKERL